MYSTISQKFAKIRKNSQKNIRMIQSSRKVVQQSGLPNAQSDESLASPQLTHTQNNRANKTDTHALGLAALLSGSECRTALMFISTQSRYYLKSMISI
jgi:hypothetical protein